MLIPFCIDIPYSWPGSLGLYGFSGLLRGWRVFAWFLWVSLALLGECVFFFFFFFFFFFCSSFCYCIRLFVCCSLCR